MADIRDMKKEDWGEVSLILKQGIDTNNASFALEAPSWEEWDAGHTESNRFVSFRGPLITGFTSLAPFSSRDFYSGVGEISVYVREGERGKGTGEALVRRQMDAAAQNGFWSLTSLIMDTNEASVRLHAKCGFRLVGTFRDLARDRHGMWRGVHVMQANLAPVPGGARGC